MESKMYSATMFKKLLEDQEYECIDVADVHPGDAQVLAPREVEYEDALEIDAELGCSDGVRAEPVGVNKAELEQVDRHEGHYRGARYGQVRHAESRTLGKCEHHVPRALQAQDGVQNSYEQVELAESELLTSASFMPHVRFRTTTECKTMESKTCTATMYG